MDERVASMREFVANFWISETLRGEFDSGCVAVSSVFQSSRDPHLRTSLTHESIVILLGARREGDTEAAHKLQAAALIYRRGNIRVVDRKGSEKKSCECYRVIRQQRKYLHRKLPRLLSSRLRRLPRFAVANNPRDCCPNHRARNRRTDDCDDMGLCVGTRTKGQPP